MSIRALIPSLLLGSPLALAQSVPTLPARTTIPIAFTQTISAERSHPGDSFQAVTIQVVRLPGGVVLPAGTKVVGHVVAANAFAYDKTPYAQQHPSTLAIQFDGVQLASETVPLKVSIRAMAGPIAANDAREPTPSGWDPTGVMTQIGGDRISRWQSEVTNRDGDTVAYNRHDGVYAHLIAHGACDGGSDEVSVGIFSPMACGLYGFGSVSATTLGSTGAPSQVRLVSTHGSPALWKHTNALLEVLPEPAR